MRIKVLIVDDSSFFRRRLSELLMRDPDFEVIGTAINGAEAVKMVKELKPQVVTMDIEMPVMDGITAVRKIMAENPLPILMFSSLTQSGAQATLDALEAGAVDYLPKKFEDIATNKEDAILLLQQRVKAIAKKTITKRVSASPEPSKYTVPAPTVAAPAPTTTRKTLSKASGKKYKILAIGTSTGGPIALQKVLTKLPANYPLPIVLVQHMPAAFTGAFASRLNDLCKIKVKEAATGDILTPGCAYLAPGGQQMIIDRGNKITITQSGPEINYKPCVDLTFASISKIFKNEVLGIILTGMGADGREGCRLLKGQGATIWAQNEESCVVYGMPMAVVSAGLADLVLSLDDFGDAIQKESGIN